MRINKSYLYSSILEVPVISDCSISSHIVFMVLFTFMYVCNLNFLCLWSALPGVPVLLRVLLSAYLQGVQHGPPHGPHLYLPAGRHAGLQGHHHSAAGGGAAGTTGCAGETRIQRIKGWRCASGNVLSAHSAPLPLRGKLQRWELLLIFKGFKIQRCCEICLKHDPLLL